MCPFINHHCIRFSIVCKVKVRRFRRNGVGLHSVYSIFIFQCIFYEKKRHDISRKYNVAQVLVLK